MAVQRNDAMETSQMVLLTSISSKDLLQCLIDNGIVDSVDEVAEKITMQKRRDILNNHTYSIWQGKTNGNWYTHLPDERKGRRLVQRKTKESVEDAIVEYYDDLDKNPTVGDIFTEWVKRKVSSGDIVAQTGQRYTRDFEKYFAPIRNRAIKSITEFDIEGFVKQTIREYELTNKAYSNIRTLLYGTFRTAKKKGIISYSITDVVHDFDLSKKAFSKSKRDKDKEVLTAQELTALRSYLTRDEADSLDLGLLLDTHSGLRIGELAALKICDIDIKNGVIHVKRTEVSRYENGNKGKRIYEVRDFPKTEAGIRDVYLSDAGVELLKQIRRANPFGEYLFEKDGERVLTYQFRYRLGKDCEKAGIAKKPPHALRRTYASILLDGNVNESFIISQMGHTKIETTKKHYHKDRATGDEKRTLLNNVSGL